MRYRVEIEGETYDVAVVRDGSRIVSVTVNGEPVNADIEVGPNQVRLRFQDRVDIALTGPAAKSMHAVLGSHHVAAAVLTPTEVAKAEAGNAARGGAGSISAPMPGRIVHVNAQPGDTVEAGQTLIVMEAMKMENELSAGQAGTIAAVHVNVGDSVEKGALLVVVEPAASA